MARRIRRRAEGDRGADDRFMLQTLHAAHGQRLPVYGMNCGTIGFLMNAYALEDHPHGWRQRRRR